MKLISARLLMALFLLAVLILGTRLVWVAATTETGWQTLGLSWYNAVLGLIGREREPIRDRDPAEQADIWLREVDRVLAAHPDDAQIAMGAACILDSPGRGFRGKYTTFSTSFLPLVVPRTDDEAILQAADRFEAKCAARCLALGARATELQPGNVDWWRLRALLLFRESSHGAEDFVPRDPNWLAILDQCARHDPDNALYDYLAALRLWSASGETDWDKSFTFLILQVDNAERFAEGAARYEQGQRKRCLALGQAASPAMAEFLRHARQPRGEGADVAFDRLARYQTRMLPVELGYWQEARSAAREQDGDLAGALALLRQHRHTTQQMMVSRGSPDLCRWGKVLDRLDITALEQFAGRHVGLVSAEELAELETEKQNVLVDEHVSNTAREQVHPVVHNQQLQEAVTLVQVTEVARLVTLPLLIVALVGGGLGRYVFKAERRPLGMFRHLSAWIVGWGATLFLLGVCPAETLGPDVQTTIIACGASVLGIAILVVLFRRLLQLVRVWAQGPERLPVLSILGVITLWQVTAAVVLTAAYGPVGGSGRAVLDWTVDVPLSLLGLIALPFVIALGVLLAVRVLYMSRQHRRTGRLSGAPFVALGLMSLSAVLVTGTFTLKPDYLGRPCWPPVSDWKGLDGAAVNSLMNETYNASWLDDLEFTSSVTAEARWLWAHCQWRLHAGVLVSPGLSLVLVALWYSARQKRQRRQAASEPRANRRARCGAVVHCVARSALAMAACFLLVYLAAAPAVLRAVENDYQHTMAYIRNPQAHWAKVRQAEAAIRADPAVMKEIRAEVAQQFAVSEDQSTDEQSETDP